jgi:hypothetical protein
MLTADGSERSFVLVLDNGEEAFAAISRFAGQEEIGGASLTAIGAFSKATVGFFDFSTRTYNKIPIDEQSEVLSALGDIAIGDDGIDGPGADGLVFVVQTNSSTVGGLGGGIGYGGISPSQGVEFDMWNNDAIDQGDGNHVGIDVNGDIGSVLLKHEPERFTDGRVWNAWVDYDGDRKLLEVR